MYAMYACVYVFDLYVSMICTYVVYVNYVYLLWTYVRGVGVYVM